MDIFWGHHKIGLVLEVISMYSRVGVIPNSWTRIFFDSVFSRRINILKLKVGAEIVKTYLRYILSTVVLIQMI